jgi:zinc D-Ala-D-Ala carboxypeptidase
VSPAEWAQIKFFRPEEFDDTVSPIDGGGIHMQFPFVQRLDILRHWLGYPLKINSGLRTLEHNLEVGGVAGSAHVNGWAADIYCRTSVERFRLLRAAMLLGFTRIGIGTTFVHLDMDPMKPEAVLWLYP